MIALTPRLIAYGLGALAIAGSYWWTYETGGDNREASIDRSIAKAREKWDAEQAALREKDAGADAAVSVDLQEVREYFGFMRKEPPATYTQIREVRVNEGRNCPVSALSSDWLQTFNAAARNP